MNFADQIFSILTTSPGNLIYHFALAFSIMAALQSAFLQWRSTGYPQAGRTVAGLALLLLGQAGLFLVSGLAWQTGSDLGEALPVVDRAVLVLSLCLIIWLWTFPEPSRAGDGATMLLVLSIITGGVFGALALSLEGETPFNLTFQSLAWDVMAIVLGLIGVGLMFIRKPKGWQYGVSLVSAVALGHALNLVVFTSQGDTSGIIRLLNLAAYPVLFTLPGRFPTPTDMPTTNTVEVYKQNVTEHSKDPDHAGEPVRERRRYSTDPKTLQSLLYLAGESDPKRINQLITRSVSQASLADLCFLLTVAEDKNTIFIASGYDLIREEHLEGGILNKDSVPTLAQAILRGRALRMPASTTSSDLKGLGDMLGLSSAGNLLCVPVLGEGEVLMGSLMLLSPYSNRLWTSDDQTFLSNIASSFLPIFQRGQQMSRVEDDRKRAQDSAESAQSQLSRLQSTNTEIATQLETLKREMEELKAQPAQAKAALAELEQLRVENQKLQARIESMQTSGESAAPDSSQQLENELRLTLKEVARLQNSVAEANARILELEKRPSSAISNENAEVITSIAQELRQPMSSIIGYTDLLLGESVGILGALQRKFVERIKTSTERIGSLIDDLIQVSSLETGLMSLNPETVDINLIIDNAMAYTSSQLREKNITLRIDIPENSPLIQADREALQQILIHLLQNAGAATPMEGTITLRVRLEQEREQDYVLLQVTDSGGGIPTEDLARVFSRLYRADNALIEGVGDTGVGLSIAKALTEAQRGRIWVESDPGAGATFSVLLPIQQQASPEARREA